MALLDGLTQAEAGSRASVSERTIRAWMQVPAFASELARQRGKLLSGTATVLAVGSAQCARDLVRMGTGAIPASAARTSACVAVLSMAAKSVELQDVLLRLDAIENAARERTRTQ